MAQVTGRVFIDVAGFGRLRSKAGATLNMGGVKRNSVMSDHGVDGYAEEVMAPSVECTISHTAGISLAALNNITNETVHFQTDTGKSFTLNNAWSENPMELSSGEVKLRLVGVRCDEA